MAGRFDATLKDLVEQYPRDWMTLLGIPRARPVEVIDADLSTVTALADKVLRVGGHRPSLLHLELQSGRDPRCGSSRAGRSSRDGRHDVIRQRRRPRHPGQRSVGDPAGKVQHLGADHQRWGWVLAGNW